MDEWAVGLSTGCFYRRPFLDCLPAIAQGGFPLIEVCSFPAHLDYHDGGAIRRAAHEAGRLGVVCYSYHGPWADHIDLSAPERPLRETGLQEMMQAVEAAAILGARYFVLHPGPDRAFPVAAEERRERRAATAESIVAVARRCRELGLELVLENMLSHLALGSLDDFLWIAGAVEGERPGFCLDTGHAQLAGTMEELLGRMGGRLRMLHGNDNRGERDDHLPPGQGAIDWPSVVGALTAAGFDGGIVLELGESDDVARTLAEARDARAFLHHLERQAAAGVPAAPR